MVHPGHHAPVRDRAAKAFGPKCTFAVREFRPALRVPFGQSYIGIVKRVLVTGANGFVGRNAVPDLIRLGYEVHAVVWGDAPPPEAREGLHVHRCDFFDYPAQRELVQGVKPTHLLHFAWYAVHGKFWTSGENLRWFDASVELVTNFAAAGGKRAVLAGTCAEYDWTHGYCSESGTPVIPATLYGSSKNSLRQMVEACAARLGFSQAWGRIFLLYGPREDPARLVPSIIRSLLRGEPARLTHGRQVRDFLHVTDVASAFVALLDGEVQGPVNIASGQPVTIREVAEIIGEKIGRKDLLEFGAIPVSGTDPPVLVADVKRLKDEVKWKPERGLDDGLGQVVDWWKANLGG